MTKLKIQLDILGNVLKKLILLLRMSQMRKIMDNNDSKKYITQLIFLLLLFLIFCSMSIYIPYYISRFYLNIDFNEIRFNADTLVLPNSDKITDQNERSQFLLSNLGTMGDWIGGCSSVILSFASLLLIIFSINNQTKELNTTKRDIYRQKFQEQMIFMLDQHKNVLERNLSNMDTLGTFVNGVYQYIHEKSQSEHEREPLLLAKEAFEIDFDSNRLVQSYLLNLHLLLKTILNNNVLSKDEKLLYLDIISNSISKDEQLLIVLFFISSKSTSDFKRLFKYANFLKIDNWNKRLQEFSVKANSGAGIKVNDF